MQHNPALKRQTLSPRLGGFHGTLRQTPSHVHEPIQARCVGLPTGIGISRVL